MSHLMAVLRQDHLDPGVAVGIPDLPVCAIGIEPVYSRTSTSQVPPEQMTGSRLPGIRSPFTRISRTPF